MNNSIVSVRKPNLLVRRWREVNGPGTPLVCNWVDSENTNLCSQSVAGETGRLPRCD